MDNIFNVIRSNKRREILGLLSKKELEVGEIVRKLIFLNRRCQ